MALAVDVADAVLALASGEVSGLAERHFVAIIERAEQVGAGVPVRVAARALDVTEPTVRTWIDRGVLRVVPDSKPVAVTPRSLGEALAATSTIRRIGHDERLLRRLLDVIEDQRTRVELAGRIDELDARVSIDPTRIEEQLFG